MKKTFILLAALLALGTTTAALAQHGGPGGGGPSGGGKGGSGGGPGGGKGGQHNPSEIGGTVSAFAADGSSFTIAGLKSTTITVNVATTTTIKNESDKSAATLANGENVDIIGTFDTTGKILTATAILVDDYKPVYFGTVSALAADGSSFTLTGPRKETAAVTVSATTTITNHSDGSAATLANGENVLVTGTLDAAGTTLAATAIVVDDHKPPVVMPQAIGTILSLDATVDTFALTVTKATFKPTAATITVTTTPTTSYGGPQGKLTFADLTAGATVYVIGTFDAKTQTLTATRIEIAPKKRK